ncbi:MAG: tetratricopeptide repeat protein, partial [Acidobacteria bacterium]|nr:tetratricopeptide repeat protein [Acidobacteriota bacterium]
MLLCLCSCLVVAASAQHSQRGTLGQVDFPTSGSKAAQAHFLRGVAALHSFWYEEALEAFREATKVDPDFVMGYWGEAMAHNHPLWNEQDTEAARKVIANIRDSGRLTARESAYLKAVQALYGEGDKQARDFAYAAAMGKVYKEHPDDLEAASFYALSLLGAVRPVDKGYRLQMQAGAIALDVYQKNPNHPGAAHYIIHAFDDPEHAILALPAARRYAQIAPDAHHARHMPSHIFIQLGMWPEAAASNESSWATSDAWVRHKNYSIERRDYHSLSWLEYVYLQQGRVHEAEAQLAVMQKAIAELGGPIRGYPLMAATFIVETERWDLIEKLFGEAAAKTASLSTQKEAGADSCHVVAKPTTANMVPASVGAQAPRQNFKQLYGNYVRGLAAAAAGNPAEAEKYVAQMRGQRKEFGLSRDYFSPEMVEIMELEVSALASANAGKLGEAVELLRRATSLEEALRPPSGPPDIIKPSHELFGEVLLRAGRPAEAEAQFKTALLRQPNRPRSLLGLARTAKSSDKKLAARAYADYLRTQD